MLAPTGMPRLAPFCDHAWAQVTPPPHSSFLSSSSISPVLSFFFLFYLCLPLVLFPYVKLYVLDWISVSLILPPSLSRSLSLCPCLSPISSSPSRRACVSRACGRCQGPLSARLPPVVQQGHGHLPPGSGTRSRPPSLQISLIKIWLP